MSVDHNRLGADDHLHVQRLQFAPPPSTAECVEDGCWRAPYDKEGRCKRHADIAAYRVETAQRRQGRRQKAS